MGACSIEGCGKKSVARTWCHAHYKKWSLHGDPLHGISYSRGRGEGTITGAGYIAVMEGGKKRQQHIIVAEKALGKPLPKDAIVHHVDHDGSHNANNNLVICPDQTYHKLLHTREDALIACGNPNFRKCRYCKEYDDPANLTRRDAGKSGVNYYHKRCNAAYVLQRNRINKERKAA